MSEHCSACGTTIASHDGAYVGNGEETRLMCSRCYNDSIAEYLGLDYEHIKFDPVTLEDPKGVLHTFQFRSRIFSDELSLEALEITENDEGYEFSVIADADQDLYITFKSLFERIRLGLSRQDLEPNDGGYRIKDGVVRGQITSEADDPSAPLLIIDGKPISWEELGRMIPEYMGFCFKLEIFDRSEEK
jgi:hypothetical protein